MNDTPIFIAVRKIVRRHSKNPLEGLVQNDVDELNAAIQEARSEAPDAPVQAGGLGATLDNYDRAAMRAELIRDEGERLKAYKDTVGKWTIGVGRNLDDVGILPHETARLGITTESAKANGITKEQSAILLDSDIDRVEDDLDRKLPWWKHLDPVRQRVLINMAFNLGIGGLLGFRNTLGMVERGSYVQAGANMLLSKWAGQVGERAKRLSKMMKDGRA